MNPKLAEAGWPPVVIAGAFRTGVLAARGLQRRGVRTTLVDCEPQMEGFRSKYGPAWLCPNPDTHPLEWVASMVELAKSTGTKPVLIASADQFVSAIATHLDDLQPYFLVSPGARLQGALASKESQYELTARHGMPMPVTRLVSSEEEVKLFAEAAAFPCVLKPFHFREWQRLPLGNPLSYAKVAVAENADALVESWRLAVSVSPTMIAQEVIEGGDAAKRVFLSCYARDGRRIGRAMLKEFRCDPVGFGPPTVTESIEDAEVDAICDGFLRAVGYIGICEIEVKRDARDGKVKLIEVNPRLSGAGDAAPNAGVDLCWLHYLDLIGQPVQPVMQTRSIRHVVLRSDAAAVANYRRAGMLTWKEFRQSYKPPLAFFDLDRSDWKYSLKTILIVLREVFRQLSRRRV